MRVRGRGGGGFRVPRPAELPPWFSAASVPLLVALSCFLAARSYCMKLAAEKTRESSTSTIKRRQLKQQATKTREAPRKRKERNPEPDPRARCDDEASACFLWLLKRAKNALINVSARGRKEPKAKSD